MTPELGQPLYAPGRLFELSSNDLLIFAPLDKKRENIDGLDL